MALSKEVLITSSIFELHSILLSWQILVAAMFTIIYTVVLYLTSLWHTIYSIHLAAVQISITNLHLLYNLISAIGDSSSFLLFMAFYAILLDDALCHTYSKLRVPLSILSIPLQCISSMCYLVLNRVSSKLPWIYCQFLLCIGLRDSPNDLCGQLIWSIDLTLKPMPSVYRWHDINLYSQNTVKQPMIYLSMLCYLNSRNLQCIYIVY